MRDGQNVWFQQGVSRAYTELEQLVASEEGKELRLAEGQLKQYYEIKEQAGTKTAAARQELDQLSREYRLLQVKSAYVIIYHSAIVWNRTHGVFFLSFSEYQEVVGNLESQVNTLKQRKENATSTLNSWRERKEKVQCRTNKWSFVFIIFCK